MLDQQVQTKTELDPVLGVVVNPQTYRNIAYLLLAFPLGVAYFIFLVTGISLGASLAILWIGIPLLIGVLLLSRTFATLERCLTSKLLNIEIALPDPDNVQKNFWQRARVVVVDPGTWAEMFYLFSKFVLGIISFTVVVTLIATSLGLMATPFFWMQWGMEIEAWDVGIPGIWTVDSFPKAVGVSLIGAMIGVASLHLTNGLAWLYGEYSKAILESAIDKSE
ncbi:MAG: sensor domain-containing protein [Trueperaceae bacterium]